jgi:hypothetical protein
MTAIAGIAHNGTVWIGGDLEQKGLLPGDGRTLARDDYPALYAAIEAMSDPKKDDRG